MIEARRLDDQGQTKSAELERLIIMWRTSEKRKEMYEEMEHMEVCVIGFRGILAP